MKIAHSKLLHTLMLLLTSGIQFSVAAELEAEVRAGVGVSDNIARTSTMEIDETIATVGFDFAATEQTRRLDLDIRSNVDYLDYVDDTYDAEWVGGLNGLAIFSLIDERLTWDIRDNFGQQSLDPLEVARPGNRENVNFFTTGPTLTSSAGGRNPIVLDARYSRVSYEERPFDNDRLSGRLSVGRNTSRDATASLNFFAERIEFDDSAVTPPIDQQEAYIRYEKTGARNTIDVELGYNQVEYAGDTGDGVLARIAWTRQTSANGTMRLTGGSQYSDQGNIFRFYQDITNDLSDTTDGADTAAPFQNHFIAIGYALEHVRYTVDISADWIQEDYKGDLGIDRDHFRSALRFQREISRTVFAGANIRFLHREYKYLDRRDDDLVLGLNLGYRFSTGFSILADYQHWQRNSIGGADFTENRLFIRALYTPVWGR